MKKNFVPIMNSKIIYVYCFKEYLSTIALLY